MVASSPTESLDRLVHERIRLGIVSALAAEEAMSFADLKEVLREDRKPKTEYRLTAKGRRALEHYLEQMEAILSEARDALERT